MSSDYAPSAYALRLWGVNLLSCESEGIQYDRAFTAGSRRVPVGEREDDVPYGRKDFIFIEHNTVNNNYAAEIFLLSFRLLGISGSVSSPVGPFKLQQSPSESIARAFSRLEGENSCNLL